MAGAIVVWENSTGSIECDGLWFGTEAWTISEDLTAMVAPGSRRGGGGDVVPGQRGRISGPEIVDQHTFKYKFLISGAYNAAGERYADHMAGFYSNLFELRTVTDPVDVLVAEDGCREATFHFPGDAYPPLTQRVKFDLELGGAGLEGVARNGRPDFLKRALLSITMPYGFFG